MPSKLVFESFLFPRICFIVSTRPVLRHGVACGLANCCQDIRCIASPLKTRRVRTQPRRDDGKEEGNDRGKNYTRGEAEGEGHGERWWSTVVDRQFMAFRTVATYFSLDLGHSKKSALNS